jgi:hypothetical protein
MLSCTVQVSHEVCQIFVSSVCLLVGVTLVDKNKAVICCLLATSAIMLTEKKKRKRKMRSKMWYLERNISCVVEETIRFPEWTAHFSVWKTTGKDISEACAIVCQNCAVYSACPSCMTLHSKIAQFNWECIGLFRQEGKISVLHIFPLGALGKILFPKFFSFF